MKNIAIIGFGGMGKRHALDLEEFSGRRIRTAAVYEPSDEKYAQGCEWLGHSPKRFADIDRMLDEVKPDGAVVAAPNFLHWECLKHFTGRAIPLIIEKPLDSEMDRVCEIVRFASEYKAPIMVDHIMRYMPIVMKAKEIMGSGRLGKICSFLFQQTTHGRHTHNFRRTMAGGGGQLLEKATHDFDALLHLIPSKPLRVAAICKQQYFGGDKPDSLRCPDCDEYHLCPQSSKQPGNDLCSFAKCVDNPDNEICLIELENGVFGSYADTYFMFGGYYFNRMYQIIGTEAVMRICFTMPHPEKDHYDGKIEVYGHKAWYEKYEFDYEKRNHYNAPPRVTEHFFDLLSGRTSTPRSPVDEAFAAELIAIAAYKSNSEGTFVNIKDLIPDDMKTIFEKTFRGGDRPKNTIE